MPERSADVLIAYVPVIHRGYLDLFERFNDIDTMLVLGPEPLAEEDYLRKELRAISPEQAAGLIGALGIFREVEVANNATLAELNERRARVVAPDEDVSRHIAERHLKNAEVEFKPVFLRWNRNNVETPGQDGEFRVSRDKADIAGMSRAYAVAEQSPDIWRNVGAVLTGKDMDWQASNQPLTTQNTPWAEGDPRAVFKKGVGIEMSTFMHAEASLIARSAREGVSLENTTMYVTTFPCPPCAMLIAQSGIKRLCFSESYAVLDGARVLDDAGVEVVRVPFETAHGSREVPYPTKK